MALKISFSSKDVGKAVKKSNQAARDQFKKSVSLSSSDVRKWFGGKQIMSPVFVRKIRNVNRYTVKDKSGKIFAKRTTKNKAEKQAALLNRLYSGKEQP